MHGMTTCTYHELVFKCLSLGLLLVTPEATSGRLLGLYRALAGARVCCVTSCDSSIHYYGYD